ncbi:hypothetical protein M513_08182 [Trichuris suis]|uniref:GIY-YIG domain-containing protein n=1 Tax=Trichuris suis TaxID=68888 RepID=A0A085M1A3_9BILA|nr:hypothetical protein M513_08182 [Trichuris suis]
MMLPSTIRETASKNVIAMLFKAKFTQACGISKPDTDEQLTNTWRNVPDEDLSISRLWKEPNCLRKIKEALYICQNVNINGDEDGTKTLNFRLFFKSSPNLRSILRNDLIKLPPSEKPGIVYEVKCDCSASYIGETGFTLRHRYKQHVQVLKRLLAAKWKLLSTRVDSEKESQKKIIEQCKKDSAVAAHAASCLQRLYPHVVCHEANYKQRKIKEALYIRQNTTINRDQGMEVSNIWLDLLRRTRSCLLQAP